MRLAARLARFAQRWVPDPFVIALGLTVVAFGAGLAVMDEPSPVTLASGWFARFRHPGTLAFTFQMALILVAGTTLARAPAIRGALERLADLPRSTRSAAALTALVAMTAALLNWGFGLVAGAVLARRIGERAAAAGRALNYPLVAASGYVGLMVWHGGFSGSAPLKVAGEAPLGNAPISLDQTILSPLNIAVALALLAVVPWVVSRMAGRDEQTGLPPVLASGPRVVAEVEKHRAAGLVLGLFVVALGVTAVTVLVAEHGALRSVTLDTVNLALLLLGLLLFGTPLRYARAFGQSVSEAGGILLQFPFYFGILGVMEASGLVEMLAARSADLASTLAGLGLPLQWCFDTVTFLSAGLVNLFVPSGGGQWAVQGTIVASATQDLGLPLPRAVMALAYGDEWTNMLQPFWALALLGITGLKARDILGYTLTVMLAALPVYLLAFAVM